jgi:hypothetical protein
LIFLDIDGVLNSRNFYEKVIENGGCQADTNDIDPKAVEYLNWIGSKVPDLWVVISSTWRLDFTTSTSWNTLFKLLGIHLKVYDVTPRLNTYRGDEILQWLLQHDAEKRKNPNWQQHDAVESFVIVDDDSDMESLSSRLVQVDNHKGLTLHHAKKVVEMLNQKVNIEIKVNVE